MTDPAPGHGLLTPGNRRLLLGYGPAVVLACGFLIMALLVPTVAPEKDVSSSAGGGGATQGLGTASGLPASGVGNRLGSAAGRGTGASAGRGTHTGGTGLAGGSSGSGGGASGQPGVVGGCSGRQVPGDPYAPSCVTFSGNNGGSTSRGVTANSIVVSYRIPADNISSVNGAIQAITGKYNSAAFNDTTADITRTLNDLVTYFNEHFQFYGRKIVLKQFHGQGQLTTEITDGGQSQADADALTASQSLSAFADVSALSQPYSSALSSDHVVNIGAPYMSQQYFQANAPYAWSFFPNCTDLSAEGGAIAVNETLNQPVTYAGTGVANGQPRRIAVIAPDNPVYQQCVSLVTSAMARAHHPVVENDSYTLDLSSLSQQAAAMEQKIVNDHITTIACGCDPITLIYLTQDLDDQHYLPEIFNIGAAFTDEDLLAQLFDQNAWAHAWGITNNGNIPPYGSSLGYFAAKSVDPNNPPAHLVDTVYEDLYILALGIQLAGPNLTPMTFQQGLFNYAGGNGEYGPWSFNVGGQGSWTPQHQFRFEWWNPNAVSTFDGENGSWMTGSSWYGAADVPRGKPPVFPNGPQ